MLPQDFGKQMASTVMQAQPARQLPVKPQIASIGAARPQVPRSPAAVAAEAVSKAARPSAKTAGCKKPKKAPSYASAYKLGKKPMPLPHATKLKPAN